MKIPCTAVVSDSGQNPVKVGGLDILILIFGYKKKFSEVGGTSLMCNFGVRSRLRDGSTWRLPA